MRWFLFCLYIEWVSDVEIYIKVTGWDLCRGPGSSMYTNTKLQQKSHASQCQHVRTSLTLSVYAETFLSVCEVAGSMIVKSMWSWLPVTSICVLLSSFTYTANCNTSRRLSTKHNTLYIEYTTTHSTSSIPQHTLHRVYNHTLYIEYTTTHSTSSIQPHTLHRVYNHTRYIEYSTTHIVTKALLVQTNIYRSWWYMGNQFTMWYTICMQVYHKL